MPKKLQFEGMFDKCMPRVRELRNGDRIEVVLSMPFTDEEWKKISPLVLRGVQVLMTELSDEQMNLDEVAEE